MSVNICERATDGSGDLFNTQIIFSDQDGSLVARYRKSHPFFGGIFTKPSTPDFVSFNTSFGVSFGIFTCFDMAFSQPKDGLVERGLRAFVYSYALNVPGLGKLSQELFTAKHCVTLLVSNDGTQHSGLFHCGKSLPTTKFTEGLTNGSLLVGEVPFPS